MGLDVYVGTLVRYYTGNWETILQQLGRETGLHVEVRRPSPPKAGLIQRLLGLIRPGDEAAVVRAINRWRKRLENESGTRMTWVEDRGVAYFTDKPAWDCYGALLLWAAYDELPKARRADTALKWNNDSAYQTARQNPRSRYRHLLGDTELWLPADFRETLATKSVTGEPITVGSSDRLMEELQELNLRTWAASDETIGQWRSDGAEHGSDLETSARLAFSIMYALTKESVNRRLPMKLDY